jgi:hypothetical protein
LKEISAGTLIGEGLELLVPFHILNLDLYVETWGGRVILFVFKEGFFKIARDS